MLMGAALYGNQGLTLVFEPGVDDIDGIESFRLVTGDQSLEPESAPADGRCTEITDAVQRCQLEFDISAVESSSRFLVMRRGDEQRNWVLPDR